MQSDSCASRPLLPQAARSDAFDEAPDEWVLIVVDAARVISVRVYGPLRLLLQSLAIQDPCYVVPFDPHGGTLSLADRIIRPTFENGSLENECRHCWHPLSLLTSGNRVR